MCNFCEIGTLILISDTCIYLEWLCINALIDIPRTSFWFGHQLLANNFLDWWNMMLVNLEHLEHAFAICYHYDMSFATAIPPERWFVWHDSDIIPTCLTLMLLLMFQMLLPQSWWMVNWIIKENHDMIINITWSQFNLGHSVHAFTICYHYDMSFATAIPPDRFVSHN